MDRDDLADLARFVLVLYCFGAFYVLFTSSPPSAPSRFEVIGHFGLFFVLAVLQVVAFPRVAPVWRLRSVLVTGLVVGLGTELVQGALPARAFEAKDLAADWAGTMVGASVVPLGRVRAAGGDADGADGDGVGSAAGPGFPAETAETGETGAAAADAARVREL